MRDFDFIVEGYKEAENEFSALASPSEVKELIKKYRILVDRNQVNGDERNIDWWRKQGWDKFSKFVSDKGTQPSSTQLKRNKLVGRSINLFENDTWLIVIPLDKNASCFHGKNTDWCTTKRDQSHFENYFFETDITLVYCLNKKTGEKWAIACHDHGYAELEFFNQEDEEISRSSFQTKTELNVRHILRLVQTDKNIEAVNAEREQYNKMMAKVEDIISSTHERNTEVEKILEYLKDDQKSFKYIRRVYSQNHTPIEFPERIALMAAKYDGTILASIKNPSKSVQMAALNENPHALRFLDNPSRDMCLFAVQRGGEAIRHINNPDEEVQIAAVKSQPTALGDIQNPTDNVIMTAVQLNPNMIHYVQGNRVTKEMKLFVVRKVPSLVGDYADDEDVQVAAVTVSGNAIQHIPNPTEKTQLIAVKKNPDAIRFIRNPTDNTKWEAIKADPPVIEYVKNPTIDMQIYAVTKVPQLVLGLGGKDAPDEIKNAMIDANPRLKRFFYGEEVTENHKVLVELKEIDYTQYGGWINATTGEVHYVGSNETHERVAVAVGVEMKSETDYHSMYKEHFVRFVTGGRDTTFELSGYLADLRKTYKLWYRNAVNAQRVFIDVEDGDIGQRFLSFDMLKPAEKAKLRMDFGPASVHVRENINGYEVINNPVYGKVLGRNGKVIVTDFDTADEFASKYEGSTLLKIRQGRYMIKLSEMS